MNYSESGINILAINPTDAPDFSKGVDKDDFKSADPNWALDYWFHIEQRYEHFLDGRMTAEPYWAEEVA